MLHNLKGIAHNVNVNTNRLRSLLFSRAIASYAAGLIKCWLCGNENSTAGIQFKCTKCQSLLELPDDVVTNSFRNGFQWGKSHRFSAFRIIFSFWKLIKGSILIQKPWHNNFDRFRMCYIQTNSVIGKPKVPINMWLIINPFITSHHWTA